MTKKSSRIVAVIMLIIAIIFFVVALNNPQASFPWNNIITYILYGIYVIIMIILFIAPFKRKNNSKFSREKNSWKYFGL